MIFTLLINPVFPALSRVTIVPVQFPVKRTDFVILYVSLPVTNVVGALLVPLNALIINSSSPVVVVANP